MRILPAFMLLLNGCYLWQSFNHEVLACGGCDDGYACVYGDGANSDASRYSCEEVAPDGEVATEFVSKGCFDGGRYLGPCARASQCTDRPPRSEDQVCKESDGVNSPPDELCQTNIGANHGVGVQIKDRGCVPYACRESEVGRATAPSCAHLLAHQSLRALGARYAPCTNKGGSSQWTCNWAECEPNSDTSEDCARLYLRWGLTCNAEGFCVDGEQPVSGLLGTDGTAYCLQSDGICDEEMGLAGCGPGGCAHNAKCLELSDSRDVCRYPCTTQNDCRGQQICDEEGGFCRFPGN